MALIIRKLLFLFSKLENAWEAIHWFASHAISMNVNYSIKPIIVLLSLCGFLLNPKAQSLVSNQGFEERTSNLSNLPTYLPKSTIEYLAYWNHIGYDHISYCHSDYLKKYGREKYKLAGYLYFDLPPYSGEGMVELSYSESGIHYDNLGSASYLVGKFTSSMVIGEVYEISYWLFFPDRVPIDSGIYNNIGFYLSRKPGKAFQMLETDYFFSKRVVINEWINYKFYVRALCNLNYITIGAFRNSNFPTIHKKSGHVDEYYIDNISVIRVNEDSLQNDIIPTPYCEYFERNENLKSSGEHVEASIYFQSNDSILDDEDKAKLDSFYIYAKLERGEVFVVTGHTDNRGQDNESLSNIRAEIVKNYLMEKYNISENKFFTIGMNDKNPIGDNNLEKGRERNRRTDIRTEYIGPYEALYRKSLHLLDEGQLENCIQLLKSWVNSVPEDQKIKILLDPRLLPLQNTTGWRLLKNDIIKTYNIYQIPNESYFLDSIYFADQINRLFSPIELSGFILEIDTGLIKGIPKNLEEQKLKDSTNLVLIKGYITSHGLPKISEVGRRQVRGLYNVIIHNADTLIMEKVLPILKERCEDGEAEWQSYAMMFDRDCLNRGKPQIFGTQKIHSGNTNNPYVVYLIDDLALVNARRKKIGMLPLDQGQIVNQNIQY